MIKGLCKHCGREFELSRDNMFPTTNRQGSACICIECPKCGTQKLTPITTG